VQSPLLVLASAYDSWAMHCVMISRPVPPGSPENGNCTAVPEYKTCVGTGKCSPAQVAEISRVLGAPVYRTVKDWVAYNSSKVGNGAFIYSCAYHCAESGGQWNKYKIAGQSIRQTIERWWLSDAEPTAAHVATDCIWTTDFVCNPTCQS
jgi:hypothetical protein